MLFVRGVLVLALLAWAAAAQEPPQEPAPAPPADDELTAPTQTVTVDEQVEDAQIVARLTRILEATERFTNPQVRVEEGVVFLRGSTQRQEDKEWARQLALRTEDVVAVVNNMEVVTPAVPVWDFGPAFDVLREMWRTFVQSLPLLVFGILLLILSFVVARLATHGLDPLLTKRVESEILRNVLEKVAWMFIIVLGLYFFLRVSGLTNLAVTMLGGTGLLGLVVGFAFRDIAENFLASLLISIQKPFRIGDTIEVEGNLGIVQKVTTRGTVLMAFDGNYIQIANATVYKSTIRNYTANPKLRINFGIGIGYDTSIADAQTIIAETLAKHPAVLDDPEPKALVDALGPATIDLQVYFWINGHEHSMLKMKSAAIRLTVAALTEAGVPMPDTAREIVFPKGVPLVSVEKQERQDEEAREQQEKVEIGRKEKVAASPEAEDDLSSEVDNLQAQADASEVPEEGRDIMADEAPPRPKAKT